MNEKVKQVLLEIAHDLADLRTNQGLLAARVGLGVTTAVARDAKKAAKTEQDAAYAKLFEKINAL